MTSDVRLLKGGCMVFRRSFICDTGIDPFTSYTIVGVCMKVFRQRFLSKDIIGRVPQDGYRCIRNHSHISMVWLTYIERTKCVALQHAWNGGEKHLPDCNVWADGFAEMRNHVYACVGCFWHGHIDCPGKHYKKTTWNERVGMTMGDLDLETQRWCRQVEQFGYSLTISYECEWNGVNSNADIKHHMEMCGMSEPVRPRDALCGGRTETFALYEVEDISSMPPRMYSGTQIGCIRNRYLIIQRSDKMSSLNTSTFAHTSATHPHKWEIGFSFVSNVC